MSLSAHWRMGIAARISKGAPILSLKYGADRPAKTKETAVETKHFGFAAAAVLLTLISTQSTPAQNVDCAGAAKTTTAEALICTDREVRWLDGAMTAEFVRVREAIRPRSDVPAFIGNQRRWLADRDRCATRQCIVAAYRQRIDTLESYAELRDD